MLITIFNCKLMPGQIYNFFGCMDEDILLYFIPYLYMYIWLTNHARSFVEHHCGDRHFAGETAVHLVQSKL